MLSSMSMVALSKCTKCVQKSSAANVSALGERCGDSPGFCARNAILYFDCLHPFITMQYVTAIYIETSH